VIRVVLPLPLRRLAQLENSEVTLEVTGPLTQRTLLDALEARYPMLRGTTRDHVTRRRRGYIRFFACGRDLSNDAPDDPLPEDIASGREPYLIVGAMSGG
jgi:hypothetical protein